MMVKGGEVNYDQDLNKHEWTKRGAGEEGR